VRICADPESAPGPPTQGESMSTPGFTYDPATLESASRDLAQGSASVDAQLTSMSNRLEPLHQGFQGQAGQGFQQLWTEWHDSAKRLKASLDGLSQLLGQASRNAAEMESANTRLMHQG
jgi:WXG100 family type VII secretion target